MNKLYVMSIAYMQSLQTLFIVICVQTTAITENATR